MTASQDWDELRRQLPTAARQATSDQAGRAHKLLKRLAGARPGSLGRIRLAGQLTLDLLAPQLALAGARRGRLWEVTCAGYDSILPDITTSEADLYVLFPWSARYLSHRDPEAELILWGAAWQALTQRGIRFVQVSYDWLSAGPLGHLGSRHAQGEVAAIEVLNAGLKERLPVSAFFLDLGLPAGLLGRSLFYDQRNYYWFKQPFSDQGLELLSEHLAAVLDSLSGGARKVLVTDLDNTLWGGEVGEVGPLGIGLQGAEGEAYLDFQRYLKELERRGIVLAACSKNEREAALAPFQQNPEMVLKESDFSAFMANWSPKSENLVSLAGSLNLGLESLVFIDDNERECEEVQRALPQVAVVHLAGGPANFRRALEAGLHFETAALTSEDAARTQSYRSNAAREEARSEVSDPADYLRFLRMQASLETLGPSNMARAVQLLAKTNQFNLTTRRHGAERLEAFLSTPGSYVKALSLKDRFGDLGLVALLIALPEPDDRLRIDSWVMSCRVFERTVEQRFFADLLQFARGRARELWAEYQPTSKNIYVKDLLPNLGFEKAGESDLGVYYKMNLRDSQPPATLVG